MADQQQDNGKIEKKYEQTLSKLIILFRKKKLPTSKRIPNGDIASVVDELLAERKDEELKLFKKEAGELLDSKVELDKFIKAKEEEFRKAVVAKKKEWNEKADKVFSRIENIDQLQKDYAVSLGWVQEQKEEEEKPTEEETDKNED